MICLPASVWLLNQEQSYEEKTFQIWIVYIYFNPDKEQEGKTFQIPANAYLGPLNPFPPHISWNATGLKNIQTLDNSTESNFRNDLAGKALGFTRILFLLQK